MLQNENVRLNETDNSQTDLLKSLASNKLVLQFDVNKCRMHIERKSYNKLSCPCVRLKKPFLFIKNRRKRMNFNYAFNTFTVAPFANLSMQTGQSLSNCAWWPDKVVPTYIGKENLYLYLQMKKPPHFVNTIVKKIGNAIHVRSNNNKV